MNRWHTLALVALLSSGSVALACSLAPESSPTTVLGFDAYGSVTPDPVPRNVAGWVPNGGEAFVDGGIETYRFPADTAPTVGGVEIPVSDVVDDERPSTPTVTMATLTASGSGGGCGYTGCGRIVTFQFEVDAIDDIALPGRLTYAFYFTDSPSEEVSGAPDKVLVRAYDGTLWGFGSEADEGATIFVSVRAIDQAGNVSALSEPVRVDTGSGRGCSAHSTSTGTLLPSLFALGFLGWRSRARRPGR